MLVPAAGSLRGSITGATTISLLDMDGSRFMERRVGLEEVTPNVEPMTPTAGEGVMMTREFAIGPLDIDGGLSGTLSDPSEERKLIRILERMTCKMSK